MKISESISNYTHLTFQVLKPKNKTELSMVTLAATAALFSPTPVSIGIGASYLIYLGYKWKQLPDPCEVHDIYRLPPITKELEKILEKDFFKTKIEELQKKDDFFGIAFAPKKDTNQMSPVYFRFQRMINSNRFKKNNDFDYVFGVNIENSDKKNVQFLAFDLETDKQLGFAWTILERSSSRKKEGYPRFIPRIWVNQVENTSTTHRHIGTLLFKVIKQFYKEDDFNYVSLDAVKNNGAYWYKLGFRTPKKNIARNATFCRLANSNYVSKEDLGTNIMFLNSKAVKLWKEEIEQNPITRDGRSIKKTYA